MNSIIEMINDPEMLELSKKPEKFCLHYGVPITYIKDVKIVSDVKRKAFEYRGSKFNYVELLAKSHYESEGLEAAWTEGAAIELVNAAFGGALTRRIINSFRLSSFEEYTSHYGSTSIDSRDRLLHSFKKIEIEFNSGGYRAYHLLYPILISLYKDIRSTTVHAVVPSKTNEELKKEIENAKKEIINNKPSHEELIGYIDDYIEAQKKKYEGNTLPRVKREINRYNEWLVEFAIRIIDEIGFENLQYDNGICLNYPMAKSDLTIIDKKNKTLRFAEVKNQDSFTEHQTFYLKIWINTLPEEREPFELCLIKSD